MNVLTKLRLERRLSIRQLAIKSDLSASAVSQIEAGKKARLLTLYKLAGALEVPLDDLMELVEEKENTRPNLRTALRVVS